MSMCPSSIESECGSLGLGLPMPLAQEGTKIQWDWYTGMEVCSPVSVPWDLGRDCATYV